MNLKEALSKILQFGPFWLSLICFIGIVYDFGFNQSSWEYELLHQFYTLTLAMGVISTTARYIRKMQRPRFTVLLFDLLSITLFISLIYIEYKPEDDNQYLTFLDRKGLLYSALILVFIREYSALKIQFSRSVLNPAQLFVLSFLSIIILGAGMLMLPNATHEGIRFIDALFTSTSAVCVTGLIVVDTGSYFTLFGQSVILALIQIGGLGIMTFASYFGYFFKGGTSYENQLMLRDMTNSDKLGEVYETLKRIIFITLLIEVIGALLIFSFLDFSLLPSSIDQTFFAVFHSISAFCNAGFSTLSSSLYDIGFRFNYPLQIVILGLFIIGGLGFPIVFNLYKYIKYIITKRFIPFVLGLDREKHITPWVLNLNSRIVLITTGVLLFVGTAVFFVFEYNNTLAEHSYYGKIVVSLFNAATPRTAGFNNVDMGGLHFSTLMLIFLLMWVGASPASTGGGIKTSTFAIATLNFWSLARGKERIEIFRREISDMSVRRAFAIISLSLVAIGSGIFAIAFLDPEKDLLSIAFECFSAYSTVGLSVGITHQLSMGSKLVIIALMFVGRVGMLSLLIAILRKMKYKNYRYSKEEILIN